MHSIFLPSARGQAASKVAVVVQPRAAIPYDKWPVWAKALALMRKVEDKGIGDTVHRVIGPPASEAFKKWHVRIFGKSCGCSLRKVKWNAQFRYEG